MRIRNKKSFTLLELIIVIIVLGVLTSLATPRYLMIVEKSRSVEGVNSLNAIYRAQERYTYLSNGKYSTKVDDLNIAITGLSYFKNPQAADAETPVNYVGKITRNGDLYVLYVSSKGKTSCENGASAPKDTCKKMGYSLYAASGGGGGGGRGSLSPF